MARSGRRRDVLVVAAVSLLVAAVLAGCGGDDKPGYCSALGDVQQSIKDFSVTEGGLSGVQSQVKTIEGQARTLVADVKDEYAPEAQAIQSSVDAMRTAIRSLPTPPTLESLAGLQPAAQDVVDAVASLANATKSKC